MDYVVLRSGRLSGAEFGAVPFGTRGGPQDPMAGELEFEEADLAKGDLRSLSRDPSVLGFAPVMPLKLHEPHARGLPLPAATEATWGVVAVGADRSPYTGAGVRVAVLDTGIDANHEAFTGVDVVQKDFTGEGDGDPDGHGTHCAGTIFGQDVDGLRIGVARRVEQALIGKVIGAQGASTASLVSAIQWALEAGANVVSMSLGIDFPGAVASRVDAGLPADLATSQALEAYRANVNLFGSLAAFAFQRGSMMQASIIVAASGNESRRDVHPDYEIAVAPPAAAEGVTSVGALGEGPNGLEVADFSNTRPDLAGPGVEVVSAATGGGLVSISGTSMATPHVAGVAALWAERLRQTGQLHANLLAARLIGTATLDPLAADVDPADVGMGLVQAPQ